METFSSLLAICAGNSPVTGEFPVDMTVVLGLHKFSLQATIYHHGPSMYSGHYTAFINCCKNIVLQR